MVNNFNPSERKAELQRKTKVDKALKVLEEATYFTEDEWDRIRKVFTTALQRDFMQWLRDREGYV